jgi:serine/threonine protein phosphatase 1
VFLGDYVDRGPQSKEVIDTILDLSDFCHVVPLMGNHEELFLNFLDHPESAAAATFIFNGGATTLASYADHNCHWRVPERHRQFLRELKLFHVSKNHVFVHANVPDVPFESICPVAHKKHFLWDRTPFANRKHVWDRTVVHGHTPLREASVGQREINLDTGCVYANTLTAMAFPSRQLYSVSRLPKSKLVFLRDRDPRRANARFVGQAPVYVDVGNVRLSFETVNYSEKGMLLRSSSHPRFRWFYAGQSIRGQIGSERHNLLEFTARVIRVDQHGGECRYAVQMTEAAEAISHH